MRFNPYRPRVGLLLAALLLAVASEAHAQAQISPPLVRVSDAVEAHIRRSEAGWTRETLPPPISGKNFIIDFYRLGDKYVKVVLRPALSPEEAEFGVDSFSAHIRTHSHTKLEGLGDWGYLWGSQPDHKSVTFRKGNMAVYITARLESDARRFAYTVAAALPEGDRVALPECAPERTLAAPSPLLKRWTEVSPEGGGFRALLPCDYERRETERGNAFTREVRTMRGVVTYRVVYSEITADAAKNLQQTYEREQAGPLVDRRSSAKVISRRRLVKAGFPAFEYMAGSAEEGFWRTLLVASNTHAYTLTASSSSEAMLRSAEVEEFFRSFDIFA